MKDLNEHLDQVLGATKIVVPDSCILESEKQNYLENHKKLIKTDFLNNYSLQDVNGKPIFYKGVDAQVSRVDGSPLTTEQLIERDYRAHMPQFRTREEVYEHLRAKGMGDGKAFMDAAVKLIREHKLF